MLGNSTWENVLNVSLEKYLKEHLNLKEPIGFEILIDEGYGGNVLFFIKDTRFSEENNQKFYLIQLVYGSCSVCDGILRIVDEWETENDTFLDDYLKENNNQVPKEIIDRVIEEVLKPSTFEFELSQLYEKEFNLFSILDFFINRVKKGLVSILTDTLESDLVYVRKFKGNRKNVIFEMVNKNFKEEFLKD